MMQKRMETLMQKLPAGTDAALIQSDVNRRYLTGMQSSAGTVLCFRDGAYLIIDFRYIEKARKCVKNCTVLEQHDLYEQIRELLRKHNARTLSVGNDSPSEPCSIMVWFRRSITSRSEMPARRKLQMSAKAISAIRCAFRILSISASVFTVRHAKMARLRTSL